MLGCRMPQALYAFLAAQHISYQRFDHAPVFNCAEASAITPDLPGAETKNLFLKAGKSGRYLLICLPAAQRLDLKACAELLQIKGLGFASPERLQQALGLTPGAVSLLAVINDQAGVVDVIIDPTLLLHPAVLCHPLHNSSTLAVNTDDLLRFLQLTGHPPRLLALPLLPSD